MATRLVTGAGSGIGAALARHLAALDLPRDAELTELTVRPGV